MTKVKKSANIKAKPPVIKSEFANKTAEIKSETIANSPELDKDKSEFASETTETKSETTANSPEFDEQEAANVKAKPSKPGKVQQLSIRASQPDSEFWETFKSKFDTANEAFATLVQLATRTVETPPAKTIIEVKEVIKQVPIPLKGSQFVCELEEETAINARRAMAYLRKEGKMNSFDPNQFVNLAVKYFIDKEYSTILK